MQTIRTRLRNYWDADWSAFSPSKKMYGIVIVVAFVYPFTELFMKTGNPGLKFGLDDLIALLRGQVSYQAPAVVKTVFPYVWILVVLSCYLFRVYMIISSYFISLKVFDRHKFQREFWTYLSSAVVVFASTFLFFRLVGLIALLFGHPFESGVKSVELAVNAIQHFINTHVPTLVELPYPLALLSILLGLSLSSLGAYFVHWLTHQSRFLWLTVHRPHHMPEILHPIGAPLAFNFDFLLVLPGLVFNVFFAKLFYSGSLLLETTLVLTFYYHFEIFNHLPTHYHFAYTNKIVRFFSDLTGSGIYHYMHHTSEKGRETVNLGGGIFMLWDRIFGTFIMPGEEPPVTGLSGNPQTVMNPLRITFSGFAQILYELKHNRDFKTRWRILFGGVFYKPPVSKEYLILAYPAEKAAH